MSTDDIVFYVPVHSNFSQVEHTAAFLSDYPSKLFIYQWNSAIKQIIEYYSQKEWSKIEGIFSFSVEQLVECLQEDSKQHPARKVVVLLTASPNYSFGAAQKLFFTTLQKHFPIIKDVFFVGHCLFGCQSCGIHEHSVPVYFTRFIRGQLPYTTKDIKNILYQQMLGKQIKRKLCTVLICPSVGPLSFLFNDKVIDALIAAQQNLHFVFMVKLHNFCYLPAGHPLSTISDVERANVEKLKQHFVVIDQSQFTILPMLQAFDVIISDVDSSVTFESLYFWPKVVCAYHLPKQDLPEQNYLNFLNLFHDELSLTNLLTSIEQSEDTFLSRVNTAVPSGREYFKSHYGEPNGHEVEKIKQLRGWPSATPTPAPEKETDSETIYNDIRELISEGKLSLAPDYLAMGLQVPNSVVLLEKFIQLHKPQLDSIDLPVPLWKVAFEKLANEVFDAGNYFELLYNEEGYKLRAKVDIAKHSGVFLVDHAWTTDFNHARQQLAQVPSLLQRLANIFDLSPQEEEEEQEQEEDAPSDTVQQLEEQTAVVSIEEQGQPEQQETQEDLVTQVWDKMWHYNQTYKIWGTDDPVWYVLDEVGSAIGHSDEPNTTCMPFIYVSLPSSSNENNGGPTSAAFSLLWPVRDIKQGEFITRDFYPQRIDPVHRAAHLVAFGDFVHLDKDALFAQFEDKRKALYAKPTIKALAPTKPHPKSTRSHYKVYTDTDLVAKNLTCSNFEIVSKEEDADIIWLADEYKYFSMMKESQFVNQFPNENRITFKHLMPETVYNLYGFGKVSWLPLTFDMESQLPEFVAEYQRRQANQEDNTWMVKPWNLGRSLDIYISNNLDCLIRLSETGPKVATKYIHNPILYEGRKFDLRFIVLLKSVDPLEVYMYNFFWIRLANNTYSLDNFEVYEKHFTVMNYTAFKMQQLHYKDFIANIEKQYPGVNWVDVQHRINKMTKEVFAAAAADPQFGKSHQSRGMYGLDVMLDQDFIPQLLEINFSPDTTRACNYDPPFYNNLFSVLFLNKGEGPDTAWGAVTDISDL
mmetsp:Transcript_27904/g.39321  ORF Transcript_27904/g.39321 Transcript_27904/m.39321 type:complete len:1031 (-) Transcript_27904:63-3155(-)